MAEKVIKRKQKKSIRAEVGEPVVVPKPRSGKERALDGRRNFQEVKVCVANLDNGMTERKVIWTTYHPSDQPPPMPYVMKPVLSTCTRK